MVQRHPAGKQAIQGRRLWMFELRQRNHMAKLSGTPAIPVRAVSHDRTRDDRTRSSATQPGSAISEHVPQDPRHRLRVAIVAPSLNYVGGQSVQADLLVRHWQGDPDVLARLVPVDTPFPRFLKWVQPVRGLRTVLREPFYLASLWRELKNTDVAHIFSASYWSFLLAVVPAWLLARMRGKKAVINYGSGEARDHLQRFRSGRYVLSRADRLIVPSGYLVDVFREFGLEAEVVANIIDTNQFRYRERQPLRPHLVCTRGFSAYYAVDVVVKAFAEVQKAIPAARLDLAGGGPLEAEIRKLVADLHLSNVHFVGVVSRQDIGRCYDVADIFINASWLDNMPVSILEAFAAGTPVVTTASPSMKYLVENERTALLSPVGDVGALAASVLRLLGEPELVTRLARGGMAELRKYSWDTVRPQWLEVYTGLLPKRRVS